jgi:hypothetical protein
MSQEGATLDGAAVGLVVVVVVSRVRRPPVFPLFFERRGACRLERRSRSAFS